MLQSIGFRPWCRIGFGFLMLTKVLMLCILVHSSLLRVARLHVILQTSSVQRVSTLKPQHRLLIIRPPVLLQRLIYSNRIIWCLAIVHQWTTISPFQGCLPHTFRKERHRYSCGSLFVDHASSKIINFPQYSNTAHKTLQSINQLEAMSREEGFKIKSYHSNNRIFATANFKAHCERSQQTFSFSGVGPKHQNGLTKRNIKPLHIGLALTCFI